MNPPLPKPAIKGPTGTGTYFDGFTEAQLLAYRADVIEMCAVLSTMNVWAGAEFAEKLRSLK